ncbi:MAG: hypothetical protein HY063_08030 [Bacteroidetes bacterium]|nr:hypothetical protein [Bacteroidota bacterium]
MGRIIRTIIRRVLVALLFPKRINDFINYARAIYSAMNGNPNFPNAAGRLAQLLTDVNQLASDEAGTKRRPPTATVTQRNISYEKAKRDLYSLRDNDVQPAADANPASAEATINSAAMATRKQASHTPRQDAVKLGKQAGSVICTGKVAGAHEWQQTPDGGVTIVNIDSTSGSKKTITGLTSAMRMAFRSRPILRKGRPSAWSQWLSIVVQ